MSTTTIQPDPKAIRGLTAARYLRSLVVARGDPNDAAAFAEGNVHWLQHSAIVNALRAPVEALTPQEATALAQPIGGDFAAFLQPMTILGRLQGVHRVPFETRLFGMTTGASAHWVGVAAPKPVTAMSFTAGEATLERKKVAALAVISEELARNASINAERLLLNELAKASAAAMDLAFIEPSNVLDSSSDGSTPASITAAATTHASTGSNVAAVDNDLRALLDDLHAAGNNLLSAVWIMHPRTATSLAMLRDTGGALAYPGISVFGGTLLGIPVITSGNVPTSEDSNATTSIVLVDQDGVLLADDGRAELGVTTQASIQMQDTPEPGATQQVSMWQMNLACLRAERFVNWMQRRENIASVLTDVGY